MFPFIKHTFFKVFLALFEGVFSNKAECFSIKSTWSLNLKNHTFIGNLLKSTHSSDLIDSYLTRTLFPLLLGIAHLFSSNIITPNVFLDRFRSFSTPEFLLFFH